MIPAERKLVDIAVKMLLAHRVKRPDQASLQQREETLCSVHMHVAPCVFADAVPHRVMAASEVPSDAVVARQLVGMNRRTRPHVLPNRAVERLAAHIRDDVSAHIAATLHQCDDGWLLGAPSLGALTLLSPWLPFRVGHGANGLDARV